MANVKACWPTGSAMSKNGKGLPPECNHWQEIAYDREPRTIEVSKEVWKEIQQRYERS